MPSQPSPAGSLGSGNDGAALRGSLSGFFPQQGVGGACLLQNMQFQPLTNRFQIFLYALGRENICAVSKAVSPVGYGADDIALLPQTVYCLPHRSAGNRQSPGNFPAGKIRSPVLLQK